MCRKKSYKYGKKIQERIILKNITDISINSFVTPNESFTDTDQLRLSQNTYFSHDLLRKILQENDM